MSDLLKLSWRNLFRNPRRTFASLITVAFGTAGLLVFQGFNTGIMNQYRENTIRGYYGYGQVFTEGYYGKVSENPWQSWISDWQAVDQKLKSQANILETFPRLSFYAFLNVNGVNLAGRGEGVLAERENDFFNQLNFIKGGNIQKDDDIILGKGLADSLGAKVGDGITVLTQTVHGQVNATDLEVAGIFHMGIKAIDDQYFRLALSQAQSLMDTDRVELFSLKTSGVDEWPLVERQVKEATPGLEAIRFEVLDKVYYQNSVDFLAAQFAFIRMIIFLIVALGIFNTIAVGLLERGGEIGALRANGETRKRLFQILSLESGLIGILGGVLGVILALVAWLGLAGGIPMPPGPGITRQYLIYLEIMPSHMIQAITLPILATLAASYFPIRKLLRKTIPDLLRST